MKNFSIIMPTFRRPHTIKRAVDSVIWQTHENWELIIVDNDGSANYDFEDERIKYVKLVGKNNRGAHFARNHGLTLATNELVTFLDDDDMLKPHYLESFDFIFSHMPEVKIVRCSMLLRGQEIMSLGTPQVVVYRKYAKPEWTNEPRHDQIYFTKILDDNKWHFGTKEFHQIDEVLVQALHDGKGGLRDMEGRL
jgi:glycosyltransferase involved in cell wall biosynthesis